MTIAINDLHESKTLDTQALARVRGGYMYRPAYFGTSFTNIKELTNISEQLNIAVGSAGVSQGNFNTVSQGAPLMWAM
ncbi:hypothetical protein [Marinobacterium aestuariivivens]|uniref:Uncharacterized protein n=1 Tax=Marinobacterium aestuariivivens TaxID=1698799 RepID=A0ABW2A817_9GAMM